MIFYRDDGSCKHCVGFLFALYQFAERHIDRSTEVATDIHCGWDKPRQTSNPAVSTDIEYGKITNRDKFNPFSKEINTKEIMKNLFKTCKEHGSVLIHTIEPPSDDSDIEVDANANIPEYPTFCEVISSYQSEHETYDRNEFLEYVRQIYTKDKIGQIEAITRDQSESDLWFKYRKGRVTASVMHSVLHCNLERLNQNNYIVLRIQGKDSAFFSTEATEYGKQMEHVARNQYMGLYKVEHTKGNVFPAGLTISHKYPYLTASPDGNVNAVVRDC